MFRRSRQTQETLHDLTASVRQLISEFRDGRVERDSSSNLGERVEGLELSRAKWEAEMGAHLLKADARYKAASAAESRARTQARAYEKIAAELAPESEETLEEYEERIHGLPEGNAVGSREVWVQPMHVGVEAGDPKTQALRAKFS